MIKITKTGLEYVQETPSQKRLREALEGLNLPEQHRLIIDRLVDDCMYEAIMAGFHGAQHARSEDLKKAAASGSRAKFYKLLSNGFKNDAP